MMDDDGPPPFIVPPALEDDDVEAPFDGSFSSVGDVTLKQLDELKLPSVSRSPSPSPIPNGDLHNDDEDENGFDTPPPIKLETPKDLSLASPGGGIESFLEREAIRSDDLPVDCIGLSPAVSREPSPCPRMEEREEALSNGLGRTDPPLDEPRVDEPPEVDQAPPPESIDNGEDDDDFGDFGFAPPPPPVDHQAKKDLSTVAEEDDDWAAFQSSSAVSERKESVAAVDDSDDWAAFEAAAPAAERQPSLDDDDDWATDFASAPPPAAAAAPAAQPAVEVPTLPSLAELSIDEGIWGAEGTVDDEDDGLAFDLYARLDAEDPRLVKEGGEEEGQLIVSASLWLALRVVEEAAALRQTWEGSTTARQLYDLLHISATRPMQRARLAAAAAPSPDAVLQPTKIGDINGKSARAVTLSTSNLSISHVSAYTTTSASSTSAADSTITTAPTSLGSGCLIPSTSSQSVSPVARSPATDVCIAPPVEFDWEKSNLKTPAMQLSSATMLDMDYFSGSGGGGPPKIISSDTTLQRDLDAFGLSATSASAGMPRVESKPSVLDTILSSARAGSAPSVPRYLAPSELSLDARALHDALPSLDHLAASWIAFPVRDNGDS